MRLTKQSLPKGPSQHKTCSNVFGKHKKAIIKKEKKVKHLEQNVKISSKISGKENSRLSISSIYKDNSSKKPKKMLIENNPIAKISKTPAKEIPIKIQVVTEEVDDIIPPPSPRGKSIESTLMSPRKALEEKVGRPLAKRTAAIQKDSKIAMLMDKFNK